MLNKAFLMGRLTRDPEQRMTQSGMSVVSFSLAVDRNTKERQTDFINCVAFSNTADFIKRFFVKGQLMCVVGSIQTRTWEGQDGKKNYATEVIVSEAHFTGDRRDNSGNNQQNNDYGATNNGADNFAPVSNASENDFISVDDDQLPF